VTTSTLVEIADKVVEDLNQSSVQEELGGRVFEAKRVYNPHVGDKEAEKKLWVLVLGSAIAYQQISRTTTAKLPTIQVGFICGLPTDFNLQWLDEMALTVENAADYLRGKTYTLTDGDEVFCNDAVIPLAYDLEALDKAKQFRSFINLTFRRDG